jgi:hypothetical protein
MNRVAIWIVVLMLSASAATASPYWIEWTGDAFPETEGWIRGSSDPPAQRWLEDGSLFIDSRADWYIYEGYGWATAPGMMTPGFDETFVMQWRIKVHEIIGYGAPGILIWSDDQHALVMVLGLDFIIDDVASTTASFTPHEWHEFTLSSSNMLDYSLSIDGTPAMEGTFWEDMVPTPPGPRWGDIGSHRSLAEWDYVGFGIVPEPSSGILMLLACFLALPLRVQRLRRG